MTSKAWSKRPKRGNGMAAPPAIDKTARNINLPEHSEPLPDKKLPRNHNISTKITDEAGRKLEQLRFDGRIKHGNKITIAELLEQGIELLFDKRQSGK